MYPAVVSPYPAIASITRGDRLGVGAVSGSLIAGKGGRSIFSIQLDAAGVFAASVLLCTRVRRTPLSRSTLSAH